MKSKFVPVAIVALFATTGALAHEDYSTSNAMNVHWISHAESTGLQAQGLDKPYAQSDTMDTAWIFASPAARGAAGPIGEQDFTPDPSTSGDGMSLHWLAE